MTHRFTPRSANAEIIFESWPTLSQTISSTSPASAGSVSFSKATAMSRLTPAARACRANSSGKERLPAMRPRDAGAVFIRDSGLRITNRRKEASLRFICANASVLLRNRMSHSIIYLKCAIKLGWRTPVKLSFPASKNLARKVLCVIAMSSLENIYKKMAEAAAGADALHETTQKFDSIKHVSPAVAHELSNIIAIIRGYRSEEHTSELQSSQ